VFRRPVRKFLDSLIVFSEGLLFRLGLHSHVSKVSA
jgi:hypothetical protein